MFMNLLSIAIILGLGYLWVTRGFFSALLHLACVIAAGAIAFGLWEPVSMFLLSKAPQSGMGTFIGDAAWGLGLALPFAISLALLRVATDKIAPGNIIIEDTYDAIGGGICGAGIGLITAGIFVLSTGFLRVPASFMGYQPVQMANQGNFEIQQKLWLPVDRITSNLYNFLSQNALHTETPLAYYYPDLASAAGTQRMSEGNGNNKNNILPGGFDVAMHFTVGKGSNSPADAIFSDFQNPGSQQITMLDGSPLPAGSYIEGFLINFLAGAKEKFGLVVVGKGQLRLIAHDSAGNGVTLYPIAVTSQARTGSNQFGRFRFDGEFYVASVGGATEAPMAFEFAVPAGYEASSLYVRNIRYDLDGSKPDREFADASARDLAIQTGELLVGNATASLNLAHAVTMNATDNRAEGVQLGKRLADRVVLQKGNTPGLEVNDDNEIVNGEGVFNPGDVQGRGLDRNLRVDSLFVTKDTNIVQIQITGDPAQFPTSFFSTSAAPDLKTNVPPRLIDANGQAYNAVGFIYKDTNKVQIRYTTGRPMMGLDEADALVRSRDDQTMFLIFRPSVGVQLKHFAIGDVVLATFEPPLELEAERRR
ncbi:MAG: hypothetical protein KDA31_08045 [Phycisphaerales bacterium]|nr:hypothetical protein [Phycisphaerales bacterium]MCB9835480.1 hypothetical protein [Phycisphaera sp.]